MEYGPKQLEILMKKVTFTLGSNLEGLLFQQKNILENHLNNLMIDRRIPLSALLPQQRSLEHDNQKVVSVTWLQFLQVYFN